MFEREIKFIYDFNLNKVNKLGTYFTFEQLSDADLHPAILQYISAEIDYLIFEDRQKLLTNSVFDYSGEKVTYFFDQITEELKRAKRLSIEYVAKLILHATSFTINYLVRPKWTLTKFIFDETDHKTSSEIKQILNYGYYYKYTKKVIIGYINKKKILSLNVDEFEELLTKTDKLGIETDLLGIISNALTSMADFFNIGQIQKTKIPLPAVQLFLEEKNLTHHLRKIKTIFGSDENFRFGVNDYIKVLNSITIERQEAEPGNKELTLFKDAEPIVEEKEYPDETEPEEIQEQTAVPIVKEEIKQTELSQDELIERESISEKLAMEETDQAQTVEAQSAQEDFLIEKTEDEFQEEGELKEETIDTNSGQIIRNPTKLRIKVGEDNRIEPVYEEKESKTFDEKELLTQEENEEKSMLEEIFSSNEITSGNDAEKKDIENADSAIPLSTENKIEEKSAPSFENILKVEKNIDQNFVVDEEDLIINQIKIDEETDVYEVDKLTEKNIDGDEFILDVNMKSEFDDKFDVGEKKMMNENKPSLDLEEILEHKEITKIIEVVFDYDIEDFAGTLDEISDCHSVEEANRIIDQTLTNRHIHSSSKEAEAFRTIITEYFNRA